MTVQEPRNLSERAVQALDILARSPSFKGVPEAALIYMADKGVKHLYMAGQTLMDQGEAADALYLIVKGTVRIEQTEHGVAHTIGTMGAGDVVGEMGLLDSSPRRATITAAEDLEVIRIDFEAVRETFKEIPATLMAVVRLMNERLGRHRGAG